MSRRRPSRDRYGAVQTAWRSAWRHLVDADDTTPAELHVMGAINALISGYSRHSDRVTQARLADWAGVSTKTVGRVLRKWAATGLVVYDPGHGGGRGHPGVASLIDLSHVMDTQTSPTCSDDVDTQTSTTTADVVDTTSTSRGHVDHMSSTPRCPTPEKSPEKTPEERCGVEGPERYMGQIFDQLDEGVAKHLVDSKVQRDLLFAHAANVPANEILEALQRPLVGAKYPGAVLAKRIRDLTDQQGGAEA